MWLEIQTKQFQREGSQGGFRFQKSSNLEIHSEFNIKTGDMAFGILQ